MNTQESKRGLRQYLYEYMFHRMVDDAREQAGGSLLISQARAIREDAERRIRAQQVSYTDAEGQRHRAQARIDHPRLGLGTALGSFEDAFAEAVPGYQRRFSEYSVSDPVYAKYNSEFMNMLGYDHTEPDGSGGRRQVRAQPGPVGERLPISPYDPRFSGRGSVLELGSELGYLELGAVETVAEVSNTPDYRAVERSNYAGLGLKRMTGTSDRPRLSDVGPINTVVDQAGLTALAHRMSRKEYQDVRDWVVAGVSTQVPIGNGETEARVDPSKVMSREGLDRSLAILGELAESGTPYTIVRDRQPGQIAAQLTGTKISVRVMDTRKNEDFVGRVVDQGVSTYFSTTGASSEGVTRYTPTPEEAVDLLRYAQGKPVQRRDSEAMVGEAGQVEASVGRSRRTIQTAYQSPSNFVAVYGDAPGGEKVVIRRDISGRSDPARYFLPPDNKRVLEGKGMTGERFLRESVDSARGAFAAELDAEGLIRQAQENAEMIAAGEYSPEFSGDPRVATIQRSYWDVLTDPQASLLRPGVASEEYEARLGEIGYLPTDTVEGQTEYAMAMQDLMYVGDPTEQVRQHAEEVLDATVGTYEPRWDRDTASFRRFDPAMVASYMVSEEGRGVWRNISDITAAIRSVTEVERAAGVDPSAAFSTAELMGSDGLNDSIRDQLIEFDEQSAVPVEEHPSAFVRTMGGHVREALERNGAVPTSVLVDGQGVVQYAAERVTKMSGGETKSVTGQIGQIFAPGDRGEVVTAFASSENYMFVPGYEAHVVAQKPGENLTMEERTRLRGYEQIMAESIMYQVSSDLVSRRTELGNPASLNGTYRRLSDIRHEVDFVERSAEEGLSESWREAILKTESQRVRYGNEFEEESSLLAAYRAEQGWGDLDPNNDNFDSAWVRSGGRDISQLTDHADGFYDPMVTSGSTNQGLVRYLVDSAEVNSDGSITRGELDDRTALMKHPDTEFMQFDPYDRQQMTASNLLHASSITEPARVAQMTFGGWNFDDGIVVSKEFAESHQIRGADGQMRPLMVGDKLSDLHGNKGVIPLIVDPEMDPAQAEAEGLTSEVEFFKNNPELDMVMSPFSIVSRFNGGSVREMMQTTHDMTMLDGSVAPAAIGEARFIVTHKAVDDNTKIYDEDAISQGKGRNASSQFAWALNSKGADKIMAECYGKNLPATQNLNEVLHCMGVEMGPDGSLSVSRGDALGSERRLFEQQDLVVNSNGTLNKKQMMSEFGTLIGRHGGDLEVPFPITLPTGETVAPATDETWRMPVLSAHLRSGHQMQDGTSKPHDYTNQYMRIYGACLDYRYAEMALADPQLREGLKPEKITELEAVLGTETEAGTAQKAAQSAYRSIVEGLQERKLQGKHNIFKDELMSSRMPNSATAVWTADPRLEIDQISVSPALAKGLGLEQDEHTMVWRDPLLRDSGVRYMRVNIQEGITGAAINPAMDKCFEGDFDGDSVALVKLNTQSAKREAMQHFSVASNLLDLDAPRDENGLYPMAMHNALDLKVAQAKRPELKEQWAELHMRANEVHSDRTAGEIDDYEAFERNSALVAQISDYYRDAFSNEFGGAHAQLESMTAYMEGVREQVVETGAKGSVSKLQDAARYLGVREVADEAQLQAAREWEEFSPEAKQQIGELDEQIQDLRDRINVGERTLGEHEGPEREEDGLDDRQDLDHEGNYLDDRNDPSAWASMYLEDLQDQLSNLEMTRDEVYEVEARRVAYVVSAKSDPEVLQVLQAMDQDPNGFGLDVVIADLESDQELSQVDQGIWSEEDQYGQESTAMATEVAYDNFRRDMDHLSIHHGVDPNVLARAAHLRSDVLKGVAAEHAMDPLALVEQMRQQDGVEDPHPAVSQAWESLRSDAVQPASRQWEDLGVRVADRQDDLGVQTATAVKSFGTGVAGAVSQRGIKALRNQAPAEVLGVTHPVTQAVLQSKHDPAEAKQKLSMLMGPVRELWRGRALEKGGVDDNGFTQWQVVRDERNQPVQADPEDWKKQFKEIYESKDGLNVQVSEDHVSRIAQLLTSEGKGVMMNIEDPEDVSQICSPMDQLAYGGGFETVKELAEQGRSIYEGRHNAQFAPFAVRDNIRAMAEFDQQLDARREAPEAQREQTPLVEPELASLVKTDARIEGRGVGENKRSDRARVVRRPLPTYETPSADVDEYSL